MIRIKGNKKMQQFIGKVFLHVLFIIIPQLLVSQQFNIQSPIDFPILLSGNFGELRSTHFHSGIDIKTQGETGKKIYAIESGYISRIKIQSGGYGHALYITHPNGYTSVYAHLMEFYPELKEWVKHSQYQKKSFEIDQYLEKDKFAIRKGQVIALSGNTGRSAGPHLHFEIRDENQVPMNGLKFGLPIKDTLPPVMRKLFIYAGNPKEIVNHSNKFSISLGNASGEHILGDPIKVSSNVAFGLEVYDYLNETSNKCGVYSLELFVDSQKVYGMQIDKVGFSQMKFIRSYCDYGEKKIQGASVHKLFIEPNNKLKIYNRNFVDGVVVFQDSSEKKCKIVSRDANGNKSTLSFKIVFKDKGIVEKASRGIYLSYNTEHVIEKEEAFFRIPQDALYSNVLMDYKVITSDSLLFYSSIHIFGDQLIPMHKLPELSLKVKSFQDLQTEKLVIARFDTLGKVVSEGGRWKDGWVTAKVEGFGKYAIVADTVSPDIKKISFEEKGWYSSGDKLIFKISDNLSGIKTYNGYVDNKWVLFEYDAKSNNLVYSIDPELLEKSSKLHELKIYVMDERNNIASFKGGFYY